MDLQLSDSTASAITIRPRTSEDLYAAAEVLVDVHRRDGYPVEGVSDAKSWLSPPVTIAAWVALLDNLLVGHVLMLSLSSHIDPARTWTLQGQIVEEVVVLARLFVRGSARGRGIAKMLVLTATDWAARDGKRVLLDVMEKDHAAIQLYKGFGWERVATVKHDNGQGSDFEALIFVSPKVHSDASTTR